MRCSNVLWVMLANGTVFEMPECMGSTGNS